MKIFLAVVGGGGFRHGFSRAMSQLTPDQIRRFEALLDAVEAASPDEVDRLLAAESDGMLVRLVRNALLWEPEPQWDVDDLPKDHPVGNCRLRERIGSGGFGVVYKAIRLLDCAPEPVAIKILRPEVARTLAADLFSQEVSHLVEVSKRRHPGVVRILDRGELALSEGGQGPKVPFIVMELLDAVTLKDHAADLPDWEAKVDLFLKVCEAVQQLHAAGLVHGDLKPGNILVTRKGQPVVVDYGLSRVLTPHAATVSLGGTLEYAAPEQMAAKPVIDGRTDVYALGVILFELLTKKSPYAVDRANSVAFKEAVKTGAVRQLEREDANLPEWLGTVIASALHVDLTQRPSDPLALKKAIEAGLSSSGCTDRDESTIPLTRQIVGPNRVSEFCRLIHRLIIHQARVQGFDLPYQSGINPNTVGFTTYVTTSAFCGLAPNTAISALWVSTRPDEESTSAAVSAYFEAQQYRARLRGPSESLRNWVFVTPEAMNPTDWGDIASHLKKEGVAPHNYHHSTILQWLRGVPALFARYFSKTAAGLPDAAGFPGHPLALWRAKIANRFVEPHRKIQLFGFPSPNVSRSSQDERINPETFRLEGVFVAQTFLDSTASPPVKRELLELVQRENPAYVLLGDPGAGKTSILRYLALVYGEGRTLGSFHVEPRVPFFLSLRDFARFRKDRPTLLAAIAWEASQSASIAMSDLHEWYLEGLLEMGEAAVLFDGLDEIADPDQRREVAEFIVQFRQSYPDCPLWVTSRLVGYDRAPLDSEYFARLEVLPFTAAQQDAFVGKWFEQQYPRETEVVARGAEVERLLRYLYAAVEEIRQMAGNPLLLTLMAWVHHHRGDIPKRRGELYDHCIQIFIHLRDEKRFRDHRFLLGDLRPEVTPEMLRRYLSIAALKVQVLNEAGDRSARSVIPRDKLQEWLRALRLQDIRSHFANPADGEARALGEVSVILDYCEERCGLLRIRDASNYAFVHLSFQEHLAAHGIEIGLKGKPEALRQRILEKSAWESWREVLLLLLYRLRSERVTPSSSDVDEFGIPIQNAESTPFLDWLVNHAQDSGQTAPAIAFWRLLGMALADELPFSPGNVRWILGRLVADAIEDGDLEGESVVVLRKVATNNATLGSVMAALLAEAVDPVRKPFRLRLRIRLLGWPGNDAESADLAGDIGEVVGLAQSVRAMRVAADLLAEARADSNPALTAIHQEFSSRLIRRMTDSTVEVRERAQAGILLGNVGDPRPGVGCKPAAGNFPRLPDFDWVRIPAGEFLMGSTDVDAKWDDETPQFRYALIRTEYWISRYCITVAQFEGFLATGYENASLWTPAGWAWREKVMIRRPSEYAVEFQTPNHPRVGVSWYEARAFCNWLNRYRESFGLPSGWMIRLPSEAEWERAARGVNGRVFPWSDGGPTEARCNMGGKIGHTSAVGLFPLGNAAESGVSDMSGNVLEWCSTKWRTDYKRYEYLANDDEAGEDIRVVRGGAWDSDYVNVRCPYRNRHLPWNRNSNLGFRVAASPFL